MSKLVYGTLTLIAWSLNVILDLLCVPAWGWHCITQRLSKGGIHGKGDTSQAYFWTKEWQEAEKEASDDIKAGRVKTFATVDELMKELEEERRNYG